MTRTLGIDIGSVSVKACLMEANGDRRSAVITHDGDLETALSEAFGQVGARHGDSPLSMVTGGTGRKRLRLPDLIAPLAIEAGIAALGIRPRAVVSMGGEDLVVYLLNDAGHIQTSYAGNKCASGTGEFFRQQLGRMALSLEDLDHAVAGAKVVNLSSRCSVFMKSDCTHRLNKGEATRGDIALSLSKVMADKVAEFLLKARVSDGEVLLIGGVTRNRHIVSFLRERYPQITFLVPETAPYFEAFGAAIAARSGGVPLPEERGLMKARNHTDYGFYQPFDSSRDRVTYHAARRGTPRADATYILGIDGGSTTTKAVLMDSDTMEIVAAHYGRTHGDPVKALKKSLREIRTQIGDLKPRIVLAATTGSSRELLGVFAGTDGVYNDIIAHAVGTA